MALREPGITHRTLFVEIDHPDSQRWKLERLRALGLTTPGVKYVPVDFASQNLAEELKAAGVRIDQPAFFAWLGVTQYISESAAMATLALAGQHAAGSEIVLDVIVPLEDLAPDELQISSAARTSSRERGEPWITFYRLDEIARRLLAAGFGNVHPLTPEDAHRYYIGQPPRITPLTAWQLVSAVV